MPTLLLILLLWIQSVLLLIIALKLLNQYQIANNVHEFILFAVLLNF